MAKRYREIPINFPGVKVRPRLNMSGKFSVYYVGTLGEYGEQGLVYVGSPSDIRKVAMLLRENGAYEDSLDFGVFLNQQDMKTLREGEVYVLFMPEYRLEYAAFNCKIRPI